MRLKEHGQRNQERQRAAAKYLDQRNYDNCQIQGQRYSTHRTLKPDDPTGRNKSQLEVFIGKLPRDLFEDELLPKLELAGRVYRIRLMMDFSGSNRGFAYATYVSADEAKRARILLHETLIRDDEPPIAVVRSFNNRKLYIQPLPANINVVKLRKELDRLIMDVEKVDLLDCKPGSEHRSAHVTFTTHEAATRARRILCPADVKICGKRVTVDWAAVENAEQVGAIRRQKPSTESSSPPQRVDLPDRMSGKKYRDAHVISKTHEAHTQARRNLCPAEIKISILGKRTLELLAACPPDPLCTIIIDNINLDTLNGLHLQTVFQFADLMTVTRLFPRQPASLEVTYEKPSEAKLVADLVNQFPDKFMLLAVPGQRLTARQFIL